MTTLFAPHDALQPDGAGWAEQLRTSFSSLEEILQEPWGRKIDSHAFERSRAQKLHFRVPRAYAALFDFERLQTCPLFRQAVPSKKETDPVLPQWVEKLSDRACGQNKPWNADAIGDVEHLAAPRLTHRYGNRAILHATFSCALYCRFCFRKAHMAAREDSLYAGSFAPALAYLQRHPEISEVILTGGDPLNLNDVALGRLVSALAALGTIKVLRLHSRMPGVLPARIDASFVSSLIDAAGAMQVVLVAHINHPKEITGRCLEGLKLLRQRGVVLLHQAVLLRGVNDSASVLHELCSTLWHAGCIPYYLHHPDWTPNTFGFRVTIERGRELMAELAGRLSGPALFTYVLDVPGGTGKVALTDSRVMKVSGADAAGSDGHLVGQLWQVPLANTRKSTGEKTKLYLDLAPATAAD